MNIAVVGATGMVGRVMLKVLEERNFPVSRLLPVASERSVGKSIKFKGKEVNIISMDDALAQKPDIALFSAGGQTSLDWAPKFAKAGTTVIDNSSAWRMHENIKLVVPEINAHELTKNDKIIANPNCSTIQLVMALKPLHDAFKIKRVIVSTYQSITGTGVKAVKQLENEYQDAKGEMAYPYPIHKNALPHCDAFLDNDYTKEEMKLTHETKKILSDDRVNVVATAVRIPVVGGHSESVNLEFEKPFEMTEVREKLSNFNGITLQDNPSTNTYPMPIYAEGKDEVFVGRLRRDFSIKNGLNLWIVADNLRKGATTNAVQIAEYVEKNLLL
ncbi:aspartate-semialdehyde dehydrogenase [Flavobacterium sp. CS20]|uniref:aspartate-semialdehyde dehydrogenase n=1 Tax=Flavobacterium sp. CS20 TaxID=2775246 RepID=UPI001B3A61FA|nr:aspartate-semialdehyde dehydrogenase [Flavobacterium sp. CS20]QTY28024.1 aspartate-semialdehyde dehydrogenase [Flavobacterium sp. CS20]